ncbi:LysR family transcriptional regulator [Colwellia sp. 1_MG-2023]|uniref:LysR family transcriptional regulator n=1 Tax=Colwellia sp. 1_MG-2023 TaxID=3062649 RepID=UPI0026E3CB88|nr:LysR family transcriptional regulator [Colwellia sp. 1_MG-2023]MDO6447175.1 LysR family transcriptional regulator [Colwellia sp. 1_MG-2023]
MAKRLPTLRQMQILLALAEHKNISRVAEILHISQPSVSIQLKNLTEVFDSPLYHVNGRSLEFTEAGIAAVNTAQEMFFSLDKLHIELEDLKGAKSGVLKLAVVSTAKYFLPILLGPFCKRYPLIDVQLDIGNREQIIQRFNQNKDDYYIFSQYPKADNLVAEPFLENPLVVVAPVNHELTKKMPISLNRLSHYPFLLREHGSGTRHSIEGFCQQHNVSFKAKMTIESNQAIKHSVAAGLGLAILSSHTLDYMQDDNLVKLDVEHFPIQSQWYLVRNKKRHQTILAELFYQYLQEEGLAKLKNIAKNQRNL